MRILHIEAGRHFYGGPQQLEYLLRGLAARGVENLLCCRPDQPLAARAVGARVLPLPLGGELDLRSPWQYLRQIRATRPDLIHVHSRRGADLFGGLAAAASAIPAVLTRRVQSAEPSFWLGLKCRPYRAIVSISHAVAAEVEQAGVAASRGRLIPSAVDTDRFRPDPDAAGRLRACLGIPAATPVVGIVAQLIPRKAHAVALEALQRLPARQRNLRLVCFGRGPLARPLRDAIAAAGLGDRVLLAGHRDDLDSLLPGLDMLLHPARREGLGVAVLEAMSAGLPVIAAAAGGLVDLLRHDVDGLLVAPDDPGALAAAWSELLDNADDRRRLGRAARVRVQTAFSIAAMADAYFDLYRLLTESGHVMLRS